MGVSRGYRDWDGEQEGEREHNEQRGTITNEGARMVTYRAKLHTHMCMIVHICVRDCI